MTSFDLKILQKDIAGLSMARPVGRVTGVQDGLIQISGLSGLAEIGDALILQRQSGENLAGEVLKIGAGIVHMLPETAPVGVAIENPVMLQRSRGFAPSEHWVGRVIDPFGAPLDGKPLPRGRFAQPVTTPPLQASLRRPMGERTTTGLAVLNTLLPVVTGQRIGLFAGSGVGKSTLLASLARNMQADRVVLALIGERGREVNDFVHKVLGPKGMERSVVVAATSDQSALIRRRCAWAAMTVAEFFRDQGHNVLFLADSVTRFAEAHREIASAMGEAPALRGFPPSVTPLITSLCERAGPGADGQGDITAILSVLVAGSDMDEPVADILRGVLDGHIVLSRDIAERGRFPAIDVSKSVSRSLPEAASELENKVIKSVRKHLGLYEHSEVMIRAGLYTEGSDPALDAAVKAWPELDAFFGQAGGPDAISVQNSFDRLNLLLRRSGIAIEP